MMMIISRRVIFKDLIIKMFLPNTSILLSILAALREDLAEGSGAVILQVVSSRISVESSRPSPYPPVTRSTCKIMIMYLL